jgi:hypothetical protein
LLPADDTGDKDNVTSDKTPRIEVKTEADAEVSVKVADKTYTGKADKDGLAVIQIPDADALNDGDYIPKVTVKDAAGNESTTDGTPFTIRTQAIGPNSGATVSITAITEDTGISNADFRTNDANLILRGDYKTFTPNGDLIKLELKNGDEVIDVHYFKPVGNSSIAQNGVWTWDRTSKSALAHGTYTLVATVVDKADNAFKQMNASDKQDLTIDTQGPVGDKGLSIDTMSIDSGVVGDDFKTNDTTPAFTGKLKTELKLDERIEVQLQSKDGQVIDRALIKADGSGNTWTWGSAKVLADGEYRVLARVVDDAGNAAVDKGIPVAAVAKDVLIDTKGSTDLTDPNSTLKISAISISNDTAANGGINDDFVTSDGGNKDKSSVVNDDDKLTFNGTLSAGFTKNGGKVLVQIVGLDGKTKSSAYVEPSENKWTYEHIGALAEGK